MFRKEPIGQIAVGGRYLFGFSNRYFWFST